MSLDKTKPTLCAVVDILYYCWCWRHEKDNATVYDNTSWKEMCPIFLDASFFPPKLWLAHLPSHQQELTFAPIQMRILAPQQAGKQQVHTYTLYSSTEGLQVTPEKQLQKYVCPAVPKAVAPLRTEQRSSSLAQLITITLCLAYSPPPSSGVIICLFFHPLSLSFFFFQFYSVPCTTSCPLHSLSLACQCSLCNNCRWGSADEAMHMHAQSFSWDHGREWNDLYHHSPYLQMPSKGTVNNSVSFTD